jgi:hypothetical protein
MRKALVVGINDYPRAPLTGCVNDANAMAGVLGKHWDEKPNFKVKLVTKAITKSELRAAIDKLFAGDCEISLFYFSGHGLVTSTGGYIVTPDMARYDEGVSMDYILTLANNSKVMDKVVILDCCQSGAMGNPAIVGNDLAVLSKDLSVLTASRDSESAVEIDGKGVFTSLVVDALQGGAADLRGDITAGGVYAYVDRALSAWDQRPVFKTNVTHFTSLRSVAPPVAHEILRRICKYFPTPQHERLLDPSYEWTDTRANPANVAIMKDLQKLVSVGLVVPIGEEHMYFAAMHSKPCRLTALGHHYWRLAMEEII